MAVVLVLLGSVAVDSAVAEPTPAAASRRPVVLNQELAATTAVEPRESVTEQDAAAMKDVVPADVSWSASSGTADLEGAARSRSAVSAGLVQAGSLPVWVGSAEAQAARNRGLNADPGTDDVDDIIKVSMLAPGSSQKAGVSGPMLRLGSAPSDGSDAELAVQVDYSQWAGKGGDWASRARLVQLPQCAVSDPTKASCTQPKQLESANDPTTQTVTAVAPQGAVVAMAAAASGGSGDYTATGLSPSGSWAAGGSGGDFTWTYPIQVPGVAGDLMPELSLDYSAQSVDGRITSSNNQPSWIGEGWDLSMGFIERSYTPCQFDMGSDANNSVKTGDLCWKSENYTVAFGAQSGELVRVGSSNEWRLRKDDGTRFEKVTATGSNGDDNDEAWKVTSTDGTVSWFGRGRANADAAATNSTWTVPVFGNHGGEPCHESAFADSSCAQAWRWNLDHISDPTGNAVTLTYATETNNYGRNLNSKISTYVRGGYLSKIEYGQRVGSEDSVQAPARVTFAVSERCLVTGSQPCTSLTDSSASAWPDVPEDQICTSSTSCPDVQSPVFFTRKRLTQIQTQILSGTSYTEVERWTLDHRFPSPGDGTTAALWLQTIVHAGAGGASAMAPVQFGGLNLENRVDGVEDTSGQVAAPLNKWRVRSIKSETGGELLVDYSDQDCTTTSLPSSAQSNTRRCFPVRWTPPGETQDYVHYFHKYVVESVSQNDLSGSSGYQVRTAYEYLGAPAWRFNSNPGVRKPTWDDWAGYGKVRTITGYADNANRLREDTLYFRGLDKDRNDPGNPDSTRTVKITDSEGTEVADAWRFAGMARESITYNGPSGGEVEGSISDYAIVDETAGSGTRTATIIGETRSRTRTALAAGGNRSTSVHTSYDTFGNPTQINDYGDGSTAADNQCTKISYANNTSANLIGLTATKATRAGSCDDWPTSPTADQVIEDSRTYYDNQPLGQADKGLVTKVEDVTGFSGSTPTYATTGTSSYDSLGRATSVTDALGDTTLSAFTPSGAGLVTQTVLTSPDPDGPGPLTPHVTTTTLDPKFGAATKLVDPAGGVTETSYDVYGRPTAIWNPGRSKATYPSAPSVKTSYTFSASAPNAITTDTLNWNSQYLRSIALFDGLLRPRETQTQTIDQGVDANGNVVEKTGRMITDSIYDDRGLVIAEKGPTFSAGAPTTTLAEPLDAQSMKINANTYDGAGRLTKTTLQSLGTTKWSTTTSYGGDRTTVVPPAGGTTTTTITDAQGRATELRQYKTAAATGAYDKVTYTYTPAGQLKTMTDAAGNIWTHSYDYRGNRTTQADPDSGTSTRTFDINGQLLTSTDARGEKLAYTYDALGRKTSLRDDSTTGPVRASWTYDTVRKGVLTSSSRTVGSGQVTDRVVSFDAAGLPTKTETVVPAIDGWIEAALAKTYATTNTYNVDGTIKTSTVTNDGGLGAEAFTYTYDTLGRLKTLGGNGSYVAAAVYSAYGPLLQVTTGAATPNSSWTTDVYDNATGRLSRRYFDRETVAKSDYDIVYTYNQAGALTKQRVTHPQTNAAADTQCFTNDYLQRLTRAWTPSNGDCAATPTVAGLGGPAPYWTDWAFDEVSNRTSQTSYASAGNTVTTNTFPAAGGTRPHAVTSSTTTAPGQSAQTRSFGYDQAGNTTSRTSTAGAVPGASSTAQTLGWNPEGRLETAVAGSNTVTFIDDADGERLLRRDATTTTLYVGSAEITLNRSTNAVTAARYMEFAGETIAVRTGPNNADVRTLWSDLNNTAGWQVNRATNEVKARRTQPYGTPRGTNGTFTGQHGFVDGLNDTTLGLVRVGARDYDPATGTFLTPDPLIDTSAPQQWNAYGYGNANPLTFPDPTGEMVSKMSADGGGSNGPAAAARAAGSSPKKVAISAVTSVASKIFYGFRSYQRSQQAKVLTYYSHQRAVGRSHTQAKVNTFVWGIKNQTVGYYTGLAGGIADLSTPGLVASMITGRSMTSLLAAKINGKAGIDTSTFAFQAGAITGQAAAEVAATVATMGLGAAATTARWGSRGARAATVVPNVTESASVGASRAAPRFIGNSAGDILDTTRVTIPEGKFGYLLKNPSKSGVFNDSMGFDPSSLDSALRSHLATNFGSASGSAPMIGGGTKFVVRGPLTGPSGETWKITSAWGVDADGTIRLITATP